MHAQDSNTSKSSEAVMETGDKPSTLEHIDRSQPPVDVSESGSTSSAPSPEIEGVADSLHKASVVPPTRGAEPNKEEINDRPPTPPTRIPRGRKIPATWGATRPKPPAPPPKSLPEPAPPTSAAHVDDVPDQGGSSGQFVIPAVGSGDRDEVV